MVLTVGQQVRAKTRIIKFADDYSPAAVLAVKGELLIVRKPANEWWAAYVSHPEITDNSFGVKEFEIEPLDTTNPERTAR